MASPTTIILNAWIDGIGLLGPGLDHWAEARPILAGATDYAPRPVVVPPPVVLPPPERRRVGLAAKVALAVAQEAITTAHVDATQLAAVFSSSGADGDNCDALCRVLASDDRHISPTRFHNSVHNAAAGYWGIASGAMTPATALCAYDGSFGAGLLEALTQVAVDGVGTLLVTYEAPYPEPLHAKRPHPAAFGLALVLMPQPGPHSLAALHVEVTQTPFDRLPDANLEALRLQIPSARGLPLLRLLAQGRAGQVILEYLDPLSLTVDVLPCS
ncbi:beta-ketoacyl synthase chain length factor [uncultured Thiodictyon sp.]|uniref:beta-ketoacyl synthase chain length factor n=1 Tax=uncultured Thiodictyon sp. TaxID=1846217 RepID=UPI0025DF231D|nr:beta-ketoacyl synthase chain length factor [uncultured Thiodictyon sp.]